MPQETRTQSRREASDERRSALRMPFRAFVNKIQGGIASICRAVDLSTAGMGLVAVEGPGRFHSEAVAVEFQLPERDEVFVVHGRATRTDGRRVGIEFTRVSPRVRSIIGGYIAASRLAGTTLR